jgi:hypothetical protein
MKLLYWILSAGFVLFGLMPYNKAYNIDTTKPNQLIVRNQECGCPCPNGVILTGRIKIADSILSKYQSFDTTQLNLDIENIGSTYNVEVMQSRFFVRGNVVGADTILCDPANCEVTPHFKVESWGLVDSVPRAWIFPVFLVYEFLVNLLFIFPALTVLEFFRQLINYKAIKNGSLH